MEKQTKNKFEPIPIENEIKKIIKSYEKDLKRNLKIENECLNVYCPLFKNLHLIKKINSNKNLSINEINKIIAENKIFIEDFEKRKNNLNDMIVNIQTITAFLKHELTRGSDLYD